MITKKVISKIKVKIELAIQIKILYLVLNKYTGTTYSGAG